MNIKAYIETGILEEYVLGLVSAQERQEVACLSKIYPEIKKELDTLEQTMEVYALAHAQAPPIELKDKIFAQIQQKTPIQTIKEPVRNGLIVPLWSKIAVAASVLFALGLSFVLYKQEDIKQQNTALKTTLDKLTSKATRNENLVLLYQNQTIQAIQLNAVANKTGLAKVFWDKSKQEITLEVQNLPKTKANQQYQLWCIVGGKPINMGIIADNYTENLLKFTGIDQAAAFAITLEKRGGNPTPTLEQMVVMGTI